jgi:hypothetical protein
VKKPTTYNPAEHQRTIQLKRLAAWHVCGLVGSQTPLLNNTSSEGRAQQNSPPGALFVACQIGENAENPQVLVARHGLGDVGVPHGDRSLGWNQVAFHLLPQYFITRSNRDGAILFCLPELRTPILFENFNFGWPRIADDGTDFRFQASQAFHLQCPLFLLRGDLRLNEPLAYRVAHHQSSVMDAKF